MVEIISVNRLLIILFSVCLSSKQLLAIGRSHTDYESLVAFKNQVLKQSNVDSFIIFASSWNATNHFCSWEGVTCSYKHRYRVTALDLHSVGLVGPLPPSIFNLTFLRRLDLSDNKLYGEIPSILACLPRLQNLNLSFNSFDGDIHAILTMNHSSVLQVLDLANNHMITGKIPPTISYMSPLKFLRLSKNNIIGTIPPSLTNLSFLEAFYVAYNHLEGGIPPVIGVLHNLKFLSVSDNKLSGNIPSSFYNLSSLRNFSMTNNHLSGYISGNIAQSFPNLVSLSFAVNSFIGSLDQALRNVTSLVHLDISQNNFTGVVPPGLGKMYNLIRLNMEFNQLDANDAKEWRFLDSLTNCTSLKILGLRSNNFHGILPKSFGNLSIELQLITLGWNHILGRLPFELDRYTNLIALGMESNLLEGSIPETIGMLGRLQSLSFFENDLTGIIPHSLENLTRLSMLNLGSNELTGHIPSSLKNLQHLSYLDLSQNNLTGSIPREIFFIPSFSLALYLSYNFFTGSLPVEVGLLINLVSLDFSNNNLSGEIPKTLGSCQSLLELNMGYNFFQGPIPISLSSLTSLEILDLSHNNLSGVIPQFLQNFTFLMNLNLSFNNLEGEVPYEGVFSNSSEISLVGNEKLCGGILTLHLPKCVVKSSSTKSHHLIKILFSILNIVVMLFILLLCYTLLYRRKRKNDLRNASGLSLSPPYPKISYAKLVEATNAFSTTHLVGCGRYGSVYAGNLREYDVIVAIKVFNLEVHGALRSFTDECDALRSIRHRNLVRVLSSCSSIDIQGNEFKALIFEFMSNGNLDTWLHQEHKIDEDDVLSLVKRLSIAIDVAEALEYLHHSCEPPIIHCDIKPSNILLDENITAHVGDFGLSRMFDENLNISRQDYSSQSGIKGTIGYIAPEYGEVAPLSPSADVYSFGIVLLEMLTGRRPTDDVTIGRNNTDYESLVEFKNQFLKQSKVDPPTIFARSWNATNNFCLWEGVSCSFKHHDRVTALDHCSVGLVGPIPPSIFNLTFLRRLDLSINMLYGANDILGRIPFELDRYTNLIAIGMEMNLFEGPIPETIGMLGRLHALFFYGNDLTGIIPYSLENLTRLGELDLRSNQLTGHMLSSLKNLQLLNFLSLGYNNLTGGIPREIFFIPSLSLGLDLSYNSFTGSLPLEVGLLINIVYLDFSHNNLRGEIPKTLGSFQSLLELRMEYNVFQGPIPTSLSSLKSIEILDLSHNNISGVIPQFLQKLVFLENLNLSFNNLEEALEYLHYSCEPSIIHYDIKPSNILLDNNLVAHVGDMWVILDVGDFGLSRMLYENVNISHQDYSNKSGIKGTIGYIAPEYGEVAPLSPSADVYSFGIVLLEMLIGRRPTDDVKGKAAIDVVCNPLGKSGGALIQQFMILTFSFLTLNSTPCIGGILLVIVLAWLGAAKSLNSHFSALAKQELEKERVKGKSREPVIDVSAKEAKSLVDKEENGSLPVPESSANGSALQQKIASEPETPTQLPQIISVNRLLIILLSVCLSSKQLFAVGINNTDYKSLIAFKNQFLKKSNVNSSTIFASSWNATNHFCSWEGVTCGFKHRNRVTALDLHSVGLVGPLPPSIFNLTFLRRLDLSLNELYGEIPQILACLPRLQHLNLSFNSFDGDIHAILMMNHSSALQVLDLTNNHMITGKIPLVINSMSPLKFLSLYQNNIIGTIPPSLANLSFLESFFVAYNHLEGGIPPEIGVLQKLKHFDVAVNKLSGNIPSSFYNLSSLQIITVTKNHLSGYISANIAQAFPNLRAFLIGVNNFLGSLDRALQNVTNLVLLEVSKNNFTGVVPPDLGKMYNLVYLNMGENQFEANDEKEWRFLNSLTNCTILQTLGLSGNNLRGRLPKSFGNLSMELQRIKGSNHIIGRIPFELDRYTNLISLIMDNNHLEGSIPETIGMLGRLQVLDFYGNDLTGIIPYSLENLTRLSLLYLGSNQLTGHIPPSIKNFQHLTSLDLSFNNLTGLIPRDLFFIPSFSIALDLSKNSFVGSLPLEVGRLINLVYLDFSNNNLRGEIPKTLGSCQSLLELYMDYNFFQGPIPISLSSVKSLEILDLSHNNLSGVIPQFLQKLIFLKKLNLSFNNLEGEVPYEGVFANSSEISLIGNEKLCGGTLTVHLPKCVAQSSSTKSHHLIKILFPILNIVVMLFILLLCYTLLYRRKNKKDLRNASGLSLSPPYPKISYAKLVEATNAFSTTHLVGCGRYGSVFAGNLRDYDAIVAIKVFNLEVHGALKSFTYECDALRSIRHRNLVRVLSSCSSIDIQGHEFKALIFEFMPKGNLDTWLHREYEIDEDNLLSLEKRLSIVINVAEALEYLHHSCEPPIIHSDIKPSNILLDNNIIAHVGDFGLSRMLYENVNISNKSGIKGTIGYIAPEHGEVAPLSPSADVYSFGIVLLEMLIGRRPTDDVFSDNLTLRNHIKMMFPHGINCIVDPKMFTKEQRDAIKGGGEQPRWFSCQSINKCLLSLTELGLCCTVSSPKERPSMKDVAAKLHAIRVSYVPSG
ncbi:uncharacterized protein LOC110025981 [Phalaenopsis equestris]|uniref:uncharacterized protein LOC110025981 n=1 Tax=Phalaenopsis equestris TaxID=78828 RepID=UPI0009E18CA6|nr:uncharacterized protein LOC110025981 [Phalaenopsis equestris]